MRDNKNNLVFLVHIKDALEQITNYSKSHTFKQFEDNEWDQAAVLRYLEVIGEASSKIGLSFRQEYPEIPWREITDLRNVIIHDYMNVDLSLIWKIITKDVPTLQKQIQLTFSKLDKKK